MQGKKKEKKKKYFITFTKSVTQIPDQ